MLGAVAEAAALKVLTALGLPGVCVVQQAGGRFLILAPNGSEVENTVQALRKQCDEWLLERYTGTLALNLALSPPFSGKDLVLPDRLEGLMIRVGHCADEAKWRPFQTCRRGVLTREFPLEKICDACGIRPAQVEEENEARCSTCQDEVRLGRRLVEAGRIAWGKAHDAGGKGLADVLGFRLRLLKASEPLDDIRSFVSLRRIGTPDETEPWPVGFLANHVARFADRGESLAPKYEGVEEPEGWGENGALKTFGHLGADAREAAPDGGFRGKPFLALLKADVDHLGFLFTRGLSTGSRGAGRLSLARLAQLSRMMDLFFTGYLQGMIRREFPDTYTVYAGGDDLLLIGPWRQFLKLAARVSQAFEAYTGGNPNITLSAGLSLQHPKHPVTRGVKEAERLLESAKDGGRNRISAIFPKPIPWERYGKKVGDADWIDGQMNGPRGVGTGFVHHLLRLVGDAEAVMGGDYSRVGWRGKLAYHLARNVQGDNDADKHKRRLGWLQRLGFDDMLEGDPEGRRFVEWRLPISIALYRNRK
jgi:CRISPR-associated protein Csm1